jgi:hypothetical protein
MLSNRAANNQLCHGSGTPNTTATLGWRSVLGFGLPSAPLLRTFSRRSEVECEKAEFEVENDGGFGVGVERDRAASEGGPDAPRPAGLAISVSVVSVFAREEEGSAWRPSVEGGGQ